MSNGANIKNRVTEITEAYLEDSDNQLYKVEFKKEGKDWYLRVFIEKCQDADEKYVGISDCEEVSRYLNQILDELDLIEQNYYLEVSSPGMDRELIYDSDFVRFKGEIVDIKLYKAFNDYKKYTGELIGLVGENIIIKAENSEIELPREMVAKVSLAIIF
ncbi:MAG TPA: ribosome maturation factor RimP [Anaerovoracaceae bacterium]|nr:ribosome maturation factor RimP [Anaerovoracaceae bacterium]